MSRWRLEAVRPGEARHRLRRHVALPKRLDCWAMAPDTADGVRGGLVLGPLQYKAPAVGPDRKEPHSSDRPDRAVIGSGGGDRP